MFLLRKKQVKMQVMIFQQNYGSPGSSRSGSPPPGQAYPPNHPLSGSKHFCSICGDRASGKLKTFFRLKDINFWVKFPEFEP